MTTKLGLLIISILLMTACSRQSEKPLPTMNLEPGSAREIAYTDKGDAFWVTRTGGYHTSPWQGLTASKRQYFEDLFISADGVLLPRETAEIMVDPVQLVRMYPTLGIRESWTLVDDQRSLLVVLEAEKATRWNIQPAILTGNRPEDFEIQETPQGLDIKLNKMADLPTGYSFLHIQYSQNMEWSAAKAPDRPLFGAFLTPQAENDGAHKLAILITVDGNPGGPTLEPDWVADAQSSRRNRINDNFKSTPMSSDQPEFDKAIAWAQVSLDALIMDQMGTGIYAGLPWFDDYWGRDEFISFTGAVLVSGKYEVARQILLSFAKLQNTDEQDPNYGRVPNRAQPDNIIYNTTDGTPWFVRSVWEYYRYSGDSQFLEEMWPAVQHATKGALENWVDKYGFLRHDEADTWMDAKGPKGPWSPRGDRAVDIQFLWRDQLEITRILAFQHNEEGLGDLCDETLMYLDKSLNKFRRSSQRPLVDHLNQDGSRDEQIRPNVFLVSPLFHETCDWVTFQTLAPQLITEKGVLSLSQDDPNFHPFHERKGLYVKDAAYHNGIIWSWNSAAAISPSIRFHQYQYAEVIFEDLTHQILHRDAVGTLAELTDAWPTNGALKLSGTFSQAWSLAEYLRVYYQDILGVRPDLSKQQVTLAPRLFKKMHRVDFSHPVGLDEWEIQYTENDQLFTVEIHRRDKPAMDLQVELLVGEELTQIEFNWARASLHLRYEKGMRQWTVPGYVDEYEQSSTPVEIPINSLDFCKIDTSLDVPALRGPEHEMLSADQVISGVEKTREVLYILDPAKDERGDNGQYLYPSNHQFEAGIADILEFRLAENKTDYFFEITFANLVDPGWHPESGYQLTYCAIGFDHDPKKGTQEVGMNSQARFKNRFKADDILYLSGGFLLVDDQHQPIAEYVPLSPQGAIGSAETETIKFKLPKSVFKADLRDTAIQVAVGFQDDHGGAGLGDFRAVNEDHTEWSGGGKDDPRDSNVYDWLGVEG